MILATLIKLGAVGIIPYLINALSADDKKDKLATGSFGNIEELEGLTGCDGLKLSKDIQLNKNKTREHTLVIGATGEGKTTSIFYPNLLSKDLKGSIVVLDPKGELYKDSSFFQKSIGRTPILFSPLNPLGSNKYNLLEECKDNSEIKELAQSIILNSTKALELQTGSKAGGVEWLNMALPLFIATLIYVKGLGSPLNTISNASRILINTSIEELDILLSNSSNEDVKEQFNIFKSSLESPKTASSIKVTLNTSLQLFLDNNIIQTTNSSTFNANMLRKKPVCLYISFQEHKANYLSPFMATFFSQLINKLMDIKGQAITFMADEFANIGMINNFSSIISTCRSRDISFLICLQSTSQLSQVYGRENAKSILNNLKTKCVLPSTSDIETLNYISDLVGETEIVVKNTSKSKSKGGSTRTESYSKTRKKLMNSDEIRRLKNDEILIIAHNRKPIICKQNKYFLNEKYVSNITPTG